VGVCLVTPPGGRTPLVLPEPILRLVSQLGRHLTDLSLVYSHASPCPAQVGGLYDTEVRVLPASSPTLVDTSLPLTPDSVAKRCTLGLLRKTVHLQEISNPQPQSDTRLGAILTASRRLESFHAHSVPILGIAPIYQTVSSVLPIHWSKQNAGLEDRFRYHNPRTDDSERR
jgi:hypothetical protein